MQKREASARAVGKRDLADEKLTETVVASFEGSESERYKEIMQALVRHLHAFASEVRLTEEEWFTAIDFLTRTGQISTETRQEFILLSDVLGLSMLVVGMNHPHDVGAGITGSGEAVETLGGGNGSRGSAATHATEATVFGPFYVEGAPLIENGGDLSNGAPGEPCFVEGRVLSADGSPIGGAHLDVWQADDDGLYDVQYEGLEAARGRGHLYADEEGRFRFWTVKPVPYPIPTDGPVGELLEAANRSPMRATHIHFMVSADGHETVTTHIFENGDEYLDSDAVFGVKGSLIADFVQNEPGTAPDGTEMSEPFWTVSYDFVLAPSRGD